MAKFKIQAGAELDLLTAREVRTELDRMMVNWRTEVARGIRYRRFTMYGDVDAAGALLLDGTGDQQQGPPPGVCWLLKRLSVSAAYTPASQTIAFYHSGASDSALIDPDLAALNDYEEFFAPGETLVFAGASLTASARIWITGQVMEAPESLAWKLAGS